MIDEKIENIARFKEGNKEFLLTGEVGGEWVAAIGNKSPYVAIGEIVTYGDDGVEFIASGPSPSAALSALLEAITGGSAVAATPKDDPTTGAWQWWAGSSEEWCTVGPEGTREAIIQAATNDSLGEFEHEGGGWNLSFHIVEARQDPLRLADWIGADQLIERANDDMSDSDRVSSEYDDGPWFECTPEQEKDLEMRIKRACDEWQAAHGLRFSCSTFSHTRNSENIIVELPDDRAPVAATEGHNDG